MFLPNVIIAVHIFLTKCFICMTDIKKSFAHDVLLL